jgi:probable phosphoglycerate mutase
MTTIGIVRHGITDWNIQRIAQGSTDIPLNETGRQQAKAVAERLAGEEAWDVIISSDLSRARETAEIIAAKLGMPVSHFDPRIREMSGGEIEGTTEADRLEKWGANWREQVQGMEKLEDVAHRGREFIEEVIVKYPGKRVLMVSHGGLIGVMLKSLLPERFEKTNMGNTSITILENVESKWDCTLYNCTKHLIEITPEEFAGKIK